MGTIINIAIATEFSPNLVNRNKDQGDGRYTADEFRVKFLGALDDLGWWSDPENKVYFDFRDVKTLTPSWANEAFAYFTKFDFNSDRILKQLHFENISRIKMSTIKEELDSGYGRKSKK